MNSKTLPSLGIAAAVLLSSIALGAVPAGADDPASFDHHDRPASFGHHDRPASPTRVADGANATASTQARPVAPDAVVLDVRVYENGTASWEVVYRTRLDDAETAAAFRDYAADVENNPERYSQQFVERMNGTVRSAQRSTGREMRWTDYSVRAEMRNFPQRYGVVAYSFEWHGFAAVADDRVRVGDALSGLVLDERMQLHIEWPEGYEATGIQSRPETGFEERERGVVWNGPIEFSSDEPRVVLSAAGASASGETGENWSRYARTEPLNLSSLAGFETGLRLLR